MTNPEEMESMDLLKHHEKVYQELRKGLNNDQKMLLADLLLSERELSLREGQ
jgi:hypothetical protein